MIRATHTLPLTFFLAFTTPVATFSTDAAEGPSFSSPLAWPVPTNESHPWTRWWWLGSAVDSTNLTRLLTEYRDAGIGGVEICPIYGTKGYEDRFTEFLSPKWMDMLSHTSSEAKRLGLGLDLTTGTGWPFGGPRVTTEDASSRVNMQRYEITGGDTLKSPLPKGRLQCLTALAENGERIDLTPRVNAGRLDWTAPSGKWQLYAVALDGPVQKVKRAAPGGVGSVLDPFSIPALNRYLADFDRAFAGYHGETPRSHFHDSYEYYNAQGTPGFFQEFRTRRGYDLQTQLPALFGEGAEDAVARVKGDYRETISDLHLAYIQRWTEWCHSHGSLSRNQAHGGPGNLLDTYAAADIPEMEIYSAYSERQIPMMKIAPSAAHIMGRRLASAESFTWLTEHFQASLSQVKQAADFLFISGVNHIFFHGIPYSPAEAPWPGWQFYAAVNFGPQGGLWRNLPGFNAYVTRCQSVLQSGQPANDVLLYFPFHEQWHSSRGLVVAFETSGQWMESHPVYETAMALWNRGYAYDQVSDRLLEGARSIGGAVTLGGNPYAAVLVPACNLMPVATLKKLIELAQNGGTILFKDKLPSDVPGFGDLEKRRGELRELLKKIGAPNTDGVIHVGKGRFLVGANLDTMLRDSNVPREPAADLGIRFVRRTHPQGFHYFLANRGDKPVDGWVTLGRPAMSAVILDPRHADRAGVAPLRPASDRAAQVYLQLLPGESCILRTFTATKVSGPDWRPFASDGAPTPITGTWRAMFIEGGPSIPAEFETRNLASWTTLGDDEARRFAGTARYSIEFERPSGSGDDWLLDLGKVCESARVKLNGHDIGTLWCAPFQASVGPWLRSGKNALEVEVTNLAANRIRDMDQRKVNWKYFYDANLASLRQRSGLDASAWPLRDSGLLGPVTLTALKHMPVK